MNSSASEMDGRQWAQMEKCYINLLRWLKHLHSQDKNAMLLTLNVFRHSCSETKGCVLM